MGKSVFTILMQVDIYMYRTSLDSHETHAFIKDPSPRIIKQFNDSFSLIDIPNLLQYL